jgi:hypothetical protein
MIFEPFIFKYHVMKKSLTILATFLALLICSHNSEIIAAGNKQSKETKAAQQEAVKKSIESGRFIIKFHRLHFNRGGVAYLAPRANYIVLDRGNAIISTAYVGRQFDIKPIIGINMIGRAAISEIKCNSSKGSYVVKMRVDNGTEVLNVILRIARGGSCEASISGLRIDNSSYSGDLVPVQDNAATATVTVSPI